MVTMAVPLTLHAGGQTCVWMDAGVLGYRLCDRSFDCEHCPLDAALRGACPNSARLARFLCSSHAPNTTFPDDRVYSLGHMWAMASAECALRVRVGIDAFIAPIFSLPRELRPLPDAMIVQARQPFGLVELDEGRVALCSPVRGTISAWNLQAVQTPSLIVTDPFGAGWLAEVDLSHPSDLALLMPSPEARRLGQFDARRLRRRLAFELLRDATETQIPEWSESGADLSRLLGPSRFLSIVREFLHTV